MEVSWRVPHWESCHWDSDADTLANSHQIPTIINLSQAKTCQKMAYFLIRWIRVSKHSLMFLICKTKFNFFWLRQREKWQIYVKELLGMDLNAPFRSNCISVFWLCLIPIMDSCYDGKMVDEHWTMSFVSTSINGTRVSWLDHPSDEDAYLNVKVFYGPPKE